MFSCKKDHGFTLIELMVVVAIIGILSSIVLTSLNEAKLKARDTARMSDIHQLQIALESYFNINQFFPSSLSDLVGIEIPSIPSDPFGDAYAYAAIGTPATRYCLGITLENVAQLPTNHVEDCVNGTLANLSADYAISN